MMNIFYVDKDPILSAQSLCDKHVVKMVLESAQMLCTAHHTNGSCVLPLIPYKPTHINHPSNIWVRSGFCNYVWLFEHFDALCSEYTRRYDKEHKTSYHLSTLIMPPFIAFVDFTDPPQCMPDEYKNPDTVTAYRNYYKHGKSRLLKYTKREKPEWLM